MVRSLGAGRVLDYQKEDFRQLDQRFDSMLDAVGKTTFAACKHLLKPGGVYFHSDLGPYAQNLFLPIWTRLFGSRKMAFPFPTINQKRLLYYRSLVEEGAFRPVIDRSYDLESIHEAYEYVESEQKAGNVLLRVSDPA